MYRCEFCEVVVPPRTPVNLVVVERREVEYPEREWMPRGRKAKRLYKRQRHRFMDKGGVGWEIASEARCCPECLKVLPLEENILVGTPDPEAIAEAGRKMAAAG